MGSKQTVQFRYLKPISKICMYKKRAIVIISVLNNFNINASLQ